jgi:hypothetical protein
VSIGIVSVTSFALVLVCSVMIGRALAAPLGLEQQGGTGGSTADPIRCWWTTDKQAVHVGERFTLALTCGVAETIPLTAVADQERLAPNAMQLPPFEVISGTRHQDVVARPSRFFQYEYTLRLLGEGFFGQDVEIPSLKVSYRIHSSSGSDADGRELTYVLPALPMRIMSLVPKTATDIQDASRRTFADMEARRFRATEESTAGAIFLTAAVILLLVAAVRVVGRYRERTLDVPRPLPPRVVLRGCLLGIRRLETAVMRDGWTPELTAGALAVFRVVGALAIQKPVAQAQVRRDGQTREGQLMLRSGFVRPKRWVVSAPTTAKAMAEAECNEDLTRGRGASQATVEKIQDTLRVFDAARYNRDGELNTTDLDAALERGLNGTRGLRFMSARAIRLRIWNSAQF